MSKNIFIAGTGTDVGKTYISALILKKLVQNGVNAAYFKAAVSGNEPGENQKLIPGDALYVKNVSGVIQPLVEMCPYIYRQAYSPHLAARLEGGPVELDCVRQRFKELSEKYEYVTMEGSGGVICPLRFDQKEIWLADIIKSLGLSCLLVADAGLGAINSVGLTASYMRREGIPLKGIILNRFKPGGVIYEDNLRMCEYISGVRIVACAEDNGELSISAQALMSLYD